MDEDVKVQDGEVVEEGLVEADTSASTDQATILMNLDELIKSNIASLDKLAIELKKQREMFDDSFNNDPTFREHAEKAKEANKVKATTKAQIMRQPAVAQLSEKVKNLRSEIKERQLSLSDYLREYSRMTGVNQIEGHDGEVREIVQEFKLIKKGQKRES